MFSFLNFFTGYFWDFLVTVGLSNKSGNILFLGLDNAGKTTLLNFMKNSRVQVSTPTLHPTSDDVTIGKLCIHVNDLGGHEQARRIWKNYVYNVSGVVYLIDAFDEKRWDESKFELTELLNMEELSEVPFLILATKVDREGAANTDEIKHKFELDNWINKTARPIAIYPSSVVFTADRTHQGAGFTEGFIWLGEHF